MFLLGFHHNLIFLQFPVFAVKGQEDVTIHVRDRGGGIPRRLIGSIFEYLYTTANPVITSSTEIHVRIPLLQISQFLVKITPI